MRWVGLEQDIFWWPSIWRLDIRRRQHHIVVIVQQLSKTSDIVMDIMLNHQLCIIDDPSTSIETHLHVLVVDEVFLKDSNQHR